jgi:hypothetical protein
MCLFLGQWGCYTVATINVLSLELLIGSGCQKLNRLRHEAIVEGVLNLLS